MGNFHFSDDLKDAIAKHSAPALPREQIEKSTALPALDVPDISGILDASDFEIANPNEAVEEYTRRTAEATEDINAQCAALRHDLDAERIERRSADAENRNYTEKWNRRNRCVSLWALVIGIIGLLLTIYNFIVALL